MEEIVKRFLVLLMGVAFVVGLVSAVGAHSPSVTVDEVDETFSLSHGSAGGSCDAPDQIQVRGRVEVGTVPGGATNTVTLSGTLSITYFDGNILKGKTKAVNDKVFYENDGLKNLGLLNVPPGLDLWTASLTGVVDNMSGDQPITADVKLNHFCKDN